MEQSEITDAIKATSVEKPRGPSGAVFNPDSARFQRMVDASTRSILEIGCGKDRRVSWGLASRELWVGCDPAISHNGEIISIHKSKPINPDAQLVVFPYRAGDVPRFYPDILSAVAPNQQDIVDGNVFNSELEKFLDPRKKQTFVVVLDRRTWESKGYQSEAKAVISEWMKRNKFEHDPESADTHNFSPNSRDLGGWGQNIRRTFVRNG